MKPIVVLLFFLACPLFLHADPPHRLEAGMALRGNAYVQPALRIDLSAPRVFGSRLHLGLCWSTTRIATMAGSNALSKDDFLLMPSWRFRPGRCVQPSIGIECGFTRFDREDKTVFGPIDNTAPIVSILPGLAIALWDLCLTIDAGYSPASSSTVYPFTWSAGVSYALVR